MKKTMVIFTLSIVFYGCNSVEDRKKGAAEAPASAEPLTNNGDSFPFYVGTYTTGESEGIYKYELKADGSMDSIGLAASSNNPSFLTLSEDRKFLLAVNETQEGSVESYSVEEDRLKLISTSDAQGAHPCFISINDAAYVLTANYSSGTIGLFHLDESGTLSEALDVAQHSGQGSTERQRGPHAHSSWFVPDSQDIISIDLGTNELWFYTLDEDKQKLEPLDPPKLAMAPGAGPRHLAFHPNKEFLYVLNELNNSVSIVQKTADGTYEVTESHSTLPPEFDGENTGADIHISSDGKFLYTSNRGHNSIAIFEVEQEGSQLTLIENVDTRGDGPRNFSLSPDEKLLVVANQNTNNLVSYRRDEDTGRLEYLANVIAPTPVCIVFE